MVKADDAAADPKAHEPVTRTAKTIKPLTAPDLSAPAAADDKVDPVAASAAVQPAAPEAEKQADTPTATESAKPSKPAAPAATAADPAEPEAPDFTRDAAAETKAAESKAEAARVARAEELEQLIASGKYFVPIDAVGRRRSRLYAWLLGFCALLLAVALLDAVLDAGLFKLPVDLPHTHFFK
jgi:anti-sigma28 factor (negative regulator of flagellin synthesis)